MPDETVQTNQIVNEEQIECLINNITLPVPPRRMRIKQALKIDEIEIKGRNGKIKQPIGYQDAHITIDLEICNKEEGGKVVETARERFEQIQGMFRPSRETIQEPQEIVSTLTDACGIRQVLIKELEVHDNDLDYFSCSLQLTEFESVENQLKAQAQEQMASDEAEAQGEEAITGNEKLNESLGNPDDDFLKRQYEQGKSDAMGEDYSGIRPGDDTG